MPPRAIFKAVLHVGDVQAPVKLYSAIRGERCSLPFLVAKSGFICYLLMREYTRFGLLGGESIS
jgi:hypothetical protein